MTTSRPYVIASVAMSLDGRIDDDSWERLILSNADDFDRVDEVRASVDAILVGAETLRRDDPRLLVRSEQRRAARLAAGKTFSPVKVTVTRSGRIAPDAQFFTAGDVDKIVYASTEAAKRLTADLGATATVVDSGLTVLPWNLLADLGERGIERVMVEGGSWMHTMFLKRDLVDELHVAVAPFLVGQAGAPRFVQDAPFPQGPDRPFRLAETRAIGEVVFARYLRS
ncbi:dihydrofolate reductase family protein [Glycomyces sp. A-F 0318]|uniref:RibD family protein n=1 Tax=Glycomyces amatae TaxID=2881355 RepID=UPI001E56DDDA|nr:dihydrofolate reductase family protein [Glycomyces amatae]